MNQVFRINVGPETVQGHLPAVRVGLGFGCRFHIAGVEHVTDVPAPKIWITRKEAETVFWEAAWDGALGLWVVDIGSAAAADAGTFAYALTMCGADRSNEYIAGQGAFSVYSTIAYAGGTGGTGGTGDTGSTVADMLLALDTRLLALENWKAGLTGIGMFDAANAFDFELREQVAAITNILRGTQS